MAVPHKHPLPGPPWTGGAASALNFRRQQGPDQALHSVVRRLEDSPWLWFRTPPATGLRNCCGMANQPRTEMLFGAIGPVTEGTRIIAAYDKAQLESLMDEVEGTFRKTTPQISCGGLTGRPIDASAKPEAE